ncbi:MAG: SIS domain-containing protein [Chitinophagales bacterium]|nr:SIS domain-containing protein [Chitinophagales bacterium]
MNKREHKTMESKLETPTLYISALQRMISTVDTSLVEDAAKVLLQAYREGKTVYIFGNGGSGMTASHITGDFIKGVSYQLDKKFKMICLNDNYTAMTAFANDVSYDLVFVEPLKNFLQEGDIVIGLSGSGNSKNVVLALEYAKKKDVQVIGFCGYKGGKVKELSDINFHIPIDSMEVTEDLHLAILHIIKNKIITELHGGLGRNYGETYDKRIE